MQKPKHGMQWLWSLQPRCKGAAQRGFHNACFPCHHAGKTVTVSIVAVKVNYQGSVRMRVARQEPYHYNVMSHAVEGRLTITVC